MELRFTLRDETIKQIQERTEIVNGAEIGRQSVALFGWATEQARAGCKIVAVDNSGHQREWPMENVMNVSRW